MGYGFHSDNVLKGTRETEQSIKALQKFTAGEREKLFRPMKQPELPVHIHNEKSEDASSSDGQLVTKRDIARPNDKGTEGTAALSGGCAQNFGKIEHE